MTWDDAAEARLSALWAEGHSTNEIARRMGTTKNSIVGRAHRLRLPSRPSPVRTLSARLSDAQRAELPALVRRGWTGQEIARRFGVSRDLVRQESVALGLVRPVVPRTDGVRPLRATGAAALGRAQDSSEMLRAEAFRRHAQPGGGVAPPGPVAHPIPAVRDALAGVPARAGHPEAGGDAGCVSSLDLPPAVATRPGVFLRPRECRWPMWGDRERATGVFCAAPVRARDDGSACVYCAVHAAKAFTGTVRAAGPVPAMGATVGWRGAA